MIDEKKQYLIEVFTKYSSQNKGIPQSFIKYFGENKQKRVCGCEILEKSDIKRKLNAVMTKKNISNEDTMLYNTIRYNLNKVTNKMLLTDQTSIAALTATIQSLTSIPYTKLEHFQKLAEMIIEKALLEHKFCPIYAGICSKLANYYIENNGKRIYFKFELLNSCSATFYSFVDKYDDLDREKIIGLMTFLGELYKERLLLQVIIMGCFNKLCSMVDKSPILAEGMFSLIYVVYERLLLEQQRMDNDKNTSKPCQYIYNTLSELHKKEQLPMRSKFAICNALEYINENFENKKPVANI